MADESKTGILGHLPPLPRPALNNSVIGMEQAYRQRKGLQLLTDADIERSRPVCPCHGKLAALRLLLRARRRHCRKPSCTARRRHLCGGGSNQRGSCQVGCAGKQVEQIHHRCRTGAAWTQRFASAEQRGDVCPARRARGGERACRSSRPDSGCGCPGGKSRQRPDQRGSCQVGGRRKEVEQVHHRRRTGATRTQGLACTDRFRSYCTVGRACGSAGSSAAPVAAAVAKPAARQLAPRPVRLRLRQRLDVAKVQTPTLGHRLSGLREQPPPAGWLQSDPTTARSIKGAGDLPGPRSRRS